MQQLNRPFWFLSLFVLLLFVLPDALQHGLFMDGCQYAVVSRNFAEGHGSFWFPFLSPTWERAGSNAFMEQPPLFYALEGSFFTLFGDGFFTEKAFCLVNLSITVLLIVAIWRLVLRELEDLRKMAWLPVLLWFISPTVSWVFRNNLIENSLGVFVLASSYFCLRALIKPGSFSLLYLLLSGLFLFGASLVKGLPGLFPLMLPLCYGLCIREVSWKRSVVSFLVLAFIPALLFGLLYLFNDAARESLHFYTEERLLKRVGHEPTVHHRMTILLWLLLDLLPMSAFLLLRLFIPKSQEKNSGTPGTTKAWMFFFLLAGLCGVLPLCLTLVQREMYYVPAIPFFALALSLLLAKDLHSLLSRIKPHQLKRLNLASSGLLILCCAFALSQWKGDARDHMVLEDVRHIGERLGRDKTMYAPYEVYSRWDLQFYLLRYYNISLSAREGHSTWPALYNRAAAQSGLTKKTEASLQLNTVTLLLGDSSLIKH